MLTVQGVRMAVRAIRDEQANYDAAHCDEDSLYEKVLRAIARGTAEDVQGCARAALRTKTLKFARHCS